MATASTMAATATVKKPGPPVPPRPQHTAAAAAAASLLKNQRESVSNVAANRAAAAVAAAAVAATVSTSSANAKVAVTSPTSEQTHPVIQKKPILASQTGAAGRTIIYKSPSMNLQKKQEEREKRYSGTDFSNTLMTSSATIRVAPVNAAPKPPLKLRKAPDVPITKLKMANRADLNINKDENANSAMEHGAVNVEKVNSFIEKSSKLANSFSNNNKNTNNIVIVQSSNGVSLNRHNSMNMPKAGIGLKDTRLSLSRADFEHVGKIQIDQLQPGLPLPKPRKIVKMPVATLDVETDEKTKTTTSSTHSSGVSIFRRSKTTLDSLAARANVTTITTSSSTNGFLSGKTVEIKNNLKNAAERLFSEIIVNQHKHSHAEPATIITKHERAVQHQALLEQELAQERQRRLQKTMTTATAQTVTVVSTTPRTETSTNNCTRISINPLPADEVSPPKSSQIESVLNSTVKKTAFHEILISELAAMRGKSSSMENLHTNKISTEYVKSPTNSAIAPSTTSTSSFKTSTPVSRKRCNSLEDQEHDHDSEDVDADNIEDAVGDDEELNKQLKVGASNSPRKRCPSGCSSDSSPYGTERSSRIRTSDWIEVGDNGKQVTLTSCHISLEDSGLEDEERIDEMSSSGVGDSWDSVKEAENEKRSRSVKRVMSITDLPPLPKSLSGITKMLGSDSGLISDADANANKNNSSLEVEEKENICNNINISTNNSNNNNNNNNINGNTNSTNGNSNNYENENDKSMSAETNLTENGNGNDSETTNGVIPTIPPMMASSTLDTQLATLKKEMYGLRQLDLSLLSQLWALNDSIQEFRNMLQEQEQDMDRESYSPHSPTPSSYEDSASSEGEAEAEGDGEHEDENAKQDAGTTPKIITTQPKLTKSNSTEIEASIPPAAAAPAAVATSSSMHHEHRQPKQRPPLAMPKSHDPKTVHRMRSAPPPPPTNRKAAAPPRPT